jgi:hypothetical protein
MSLRMPDLCVALLLRPAAYIYQYASDVVVARLDLGHSERHLKEKVHG